MYFNTSTPTERRIEPTSDSLLRNLMDWDDKLTNIRSTSLSLSPPLSLSLHPHPHPTPLPRNGGRGCLRSTPCLESQGCHLFALYYLLSCSFAFSRCSFCLFCPCLLATSSDVFCCFSRTIFSIYCQQIGFWYGSCLATIGDDNWSVIFWNMLPCGTAVMQSFFFFFIVCSQSFVCVYT